MNTRTRFLLSIGIPVVLIILVVGVFLLYQQRTASTVPTSQGPRPLTTMTLALDWTPNTNHTGIYVALDKGWYRDVGISATEGVVADAAVGQPVVSIAAIIQHNTSALVSLASSGLTRPSMFDGKTYGAFGAPYETAVVGEIIKRDGGRGVFKSVTLDVDAMQALESHRIDFVWVFEGWEVIQAQRAGVKLNVFPITNYGVADY